MDLMGVDLGPQRFIMLLFSIFLFEGIESLQVS